MRRNSLLSCTAVAAQSKSRPGQSTINNWWQRIRTCTSDEELARLLRVRFDVGTRYIADASIRQERSKLLESTIQTAREHGCDVGVSTYSIALKLCRQSLDPRLSSLIIQKVVDGVGPTGVPALPVQPSADTASVPPAGDGKTLVPARPRPGPRRKRNPGGAVLVPDPHLWTSVLHNLATFARRGDDLQPIVDVVLAHRTETELCNIDYEWLVRLYAPKRLRNRAAAERYFQMGLRRGGQIRPSFFAAYAETAETYEDCKRVLLKLREHGLEPDAHLLIQFLKVCRASKDEASAEQVVAAAKAFGIYDNRMENTLLTVHMETKSWAKFDALWDVVRGKEPLDRTALLCFLKACMRRDAGKVRVRDAERAFQPWARSRGTHNPVWRLMMGVYEDARDVAGAAALVSAHKYLVVKHDAAFYNQYKALAGKPAPEGVAPPRWVNDATPQTYLPPTWACEYLAVNSI